MARFVTFLSDFGLQDEFVGTCHGVIKQIAPDVQIIDLTHGIPPQNVLHGALVLAKALEYVPLGVHLAVVDPGVGTARRPLVLEDADGRLYVGPDNGLLVPAAEAGGGIAAAHELANPRYALERVSRTFHGRDLFATGAAALAVARRFPEAEVVGIDLADSMIAAARRKTGPELVDRVRFDVGDAAALPFEDGAFVLVTHANMIPFFDELVRVVAPGGYVIFGFSGGSETPIYVDPGRLRGELERRGFTHFAELEVGRGTAFLARKGEA